ncbi:MAG: manganese efflux pump [Bacilli bacterium]|nr:manganese efflux pump [Bacilli bacterium]
MEILTIILFSLAINLDNLTLGLLYGINKVKISLFYQILIVFITTLGTIISMVFGKLISKYYLEEISSIIGFIILLVIGIVTIVKYKHETRIEEQAIKYLPKISLKEIIFVSLFLSINNIGIGIGFSLHGFNIFYTLISTVIIGYVLLIIGLYIGNNFKLKIIEKYESLITGIIIIILAIMQFII